MTSVEDANCSVCGLPSANPSQIRRNACPFCNRIFGRVDGARRHSITCPARGDRPVPPPSKRGRKLRACTECSRVKVSCHGRGPCQRCSSRNLVCSFAGVCTDPAHTRKSTPNQVFPRLNERFDCLRFLLQCTDPRVNFVNDVLAAGEPESGPALLAEWNSPPAKGIWQDTVDPRLLFLGLMDPCFDVSFDGNGTYDFGSPLDMTLPLPITLIDSLGAQVDRLRVDLELLIDIWPVTDNVGQQGQLDSFFTCANFERLIAVFFGRRQLLARMIHWPTFNPSQVDLGLLLAIALCGTAYSHRSAEPLQYAPIIDTLQRLADKYIFRRLKQCHVRDGSCSELELCQAAYLIITLQLGVRNLDTRRRAIAKRQPALVSALRRLGMMKSKNSLTLPEASWHAFVYRESCVRLITFVCFNDSFLALFCNSPPTTTVLEMVGDLPCPDELWEADCAEAFNAEQDKRGNIPPLPCMKDILTFLLRDGWDDADPAVVHNLNVFHLYAAIGGVCFDYCELGFM